jgi:enoyl-CoA hydratase
MDLVLTGRFMGAEEAQSAGLVSRVVSTDRLMEEAMEVAATIASKPRLAAMLAKESVNKAFETTLAEGIQFERRMFHALFATDDQKEGMSAFAEKRDPRWKNS